jgi:hypothetical protein
MTTTYTSPITGQTYSVLPLSDGRHITVSEFGWAIIEGDGQARSATIVEEAWTLQSQWMRDR